MKCLGLVKCEFDCHEFISSVACAFGPCDTLEKAEKIKMRKYEQTTYEEQDDSAEHPDAR